MNSSYTLISQYIFCRQRCELRKCIYRNKKEQEKHRRNVQEHTKQVEEENCVVESQQVDLSELVNGEELENSSDVEENDETNPEAHRLPNGEEEYNQMRKSYQCSKCGKTFTRKHFAKIHCKEKQLIKCESCGAFKSRKNIKRHKEFCDKNMQKGLKQAVFTCSCCGKKFPNFFNMKRHETKIHGMNHVKTVRCTVPGCSFSSNTTHQMARHTTLSHTRKDVKCQVCGHMLSSVSGLRKHMIAIHGLECDICGKLFLEDDMLKSHKEVYHKSLPSSERSSQVVISRKIGEHATYTEENLN